MKVGMLSSYPPLDDSIAKVSTYNLIKNCPAEFVRIGCKGSKADYIVNFKSFFLKRDIKKIIEKEKLDILHIQYIAPLYGKYTLNLNLLPVYKLKIPIVTTLHEVQLPYKGNIFGTIRHRLLEFIEENIVKNSDRIIVHTNLQKEFLERKYKTKKVEVVYLGLYCKKNNSKKTRNLVFFGIISPGKGIEYLIEAMKYLKKFKLIIAGSTPNKFCKNYLKKLKKEIKINNIRNIKVISKDWIPDSKKEKIYKKSSIVIIPYVWGPYSSGIVQDAAEYNLPVVITKIGFIYDAVKRYKTGEIIKPKDPKEIAEGVKRVYANYERYKRGIRKYRKEVNWRSIGEKYLKVYKEVIYFSKV